MRRSSRRSLPVTCTNKSQYNLTSPMRATCPAHTGLDFFTLIIFDEDQFVAVIFLHLLGICKVSLLLFPVINTHDLQVLVIGCRNLNMVCFQDGGGVSLSLARLDRGEHTTLLMGLLVEVCSCYFLRLAAYFCVKYVCTWLSLEVSSDPQVKNRGMNNQITSLESIAVYVIVLVFV
jgi:hypothetical protein